MGRSESIEGQMVSDFVKQVIKNRKHKGISQEKLAELLDISVVTMSFIENGESEMDVEQCVRVAEILDIPRSEIFKEHTDVRQKNGKKNAFGWVVGIIVVLLMVNIGFELAVKWYYQYTHYNYISATVLDFEDDLLTIKNRGGFSIEGDDIYKIRLNDELLQMCSTTEIGDVVYIHYYLTLNSKWINSSWLVSEIRKNEFSSNWKK